MEKKLYKIIMTHYAPKDSASAVKEYVVANSDEEVFEYLANGYACWSDMLEDEYEKEDYYEILANKGDDREVYDLYYGATQYSWEEVYLVDNEVIELMIKNGLANNIIK